MIQYKLIQTLEHKHWLEQAVRQFALENHAPQEYEGLVQQTYENILHATELKTAGQFLWLVLQDEKPVGYVMSHLGKDVDNKMCYWLTQAYADPSVRGERFLKELYPVMKKHAKDLFCSHILIPSSRSAEAYMRWLGPNLHIYATILKEDI
jgi:hypothetical protein